MKEYGADSMSVYEHCLTGTLPVEGLSVGTASAKRIGGGFRFVLREQLPQSVCLRIKKLAGTVPADESSWG